MKYFIKCVFGGPIDLIIFRQLMAETIVKPLVGAGRSAGVLVAVIDRGGWGNGLRGGIRGELEELLRSFFAIGGNGGMLNAVV
jgi:hypothetical protein